MMHALLGGHDIISEAERDIHNLNARNCLLDWRRRREKEEEEQEVRSFNSLVTDWMGVKKQP
jgi:hypothetical protein